MPARVPRSVVLASVLIIASLAPRPVQADADAPQSANPPTAQLDIARLADGRSQRTNWQPPGTPDRYGRAEVLVSAPIAAVHKLVLDYSHYKDFVAGKFHTSRIIGKDDGGTDVYIQVPILNGMVTLWQVFRFKEIKPLAAGWMMVEGFYVKGNIRRGNAAWTMRAIDDSHTMLAFDLLVLPNLPAPQSLLDEELRDAAAQAVEAIRDRAQSTPGPVAYAVPAK